MKELIKNSSAYKIIESDKTAGKLSHAYLVTCADGDMHEEYLKVLAKLMMCQGSASDGCRVCRLIDAGTHPDITFYPKEGKLKTDSADEVVRQSVIRPFELDKRLFVLKKIEDLNQYQNKLLKTLEEPPKNVTLLLSSARPAAVLSTIKSRVKTVEIPLFTTEMLYEAGLRAGYSGERLTLASALSGGKYGQMVRYYETDELLNIKRLALSVLCDMNTAKDVPHFAGLLKDVTMTDFISVLKLLLTDLLEYEATSGGKAIDEKLALCAEKFRIGAIIEITEKLSTLEKNANFNANTTMLTDGVLFAVMEGKSRWQRLSV